MYWSTSIVYWCINRHVYYPTEKYRNFQLRTADTQHRQHAAQTQHDNMVEQKNTSIQPTINKMPCESAKIIFGANEKVVLVSIELVIPYHII